MPDTRFDDPQHLVAVALIELYARGLVPQSLTVQTMSVVVELVREVDDQRLQPAWLAKNIHRLDPLVIRLAKSLLLELLDFDFFNLFASNCITQFTPGLCTYQRPMDANSLLGGFFLDVLNSYLQSDFDVRMVVWRGLCEYIATFGNPPREDASSVAVDAAPAGPLQVRKEINQLVNANNVHSAVDLAHKYADMNSATVNPIAAELYILCDAKHPHDAFLLAESALTDARSSGDPEQLYNCVIAVCNLMIEYPELVPAGFVSTAEELLLFLQNAPSACTLRVLALEMQHLVQQGAPLETLTEKLAALLAAATTSSDMEQHLAEFHHFSYLVWSSFGKTELAQVHLDMASNESPDSFMLLVREAMYGNIDAMASKLAQQEPKNRLHWQHFKLARLVLRVLKLTQREKFSAALEVLKVIYKLPMELSCHWTFLIKSAHIQLLLAQQKVQEVLEMSQDESWQHSPIYRQYMLVYSARALCESTQKIRRLEALNLARQCLGCNCAPLVVEAMLVEATALSMGSRSEVEQALLKCAQLVPLTRSLKSQRLYLDAQILHTACLLQLKQVDDAVRLFNQTQLESNREPTLAHARQLHEIRQELHRRNVSGVVEPVLDPLKEAPVPSDLKRKLGFMWDHRPHKRRSFFG